MHLNGNIRIALHALGKAKWRTFLTMLGIVIGVASVVITVSIGQGVRQQLLGQIKDRGSDLITVRPGRTVKRDAQGRITGINTAAFFSTAALNEQDYLTIKKTEGVELAAPMSMVNAIPRADGKEYENGFVVATTPDMQAVFNQPLVFGSFFAENDPNPNGAIIGHKVAQDLFGENVPAGRAFTLQGQTFVVRGVFDTFPSSPLTPNADYNAAIFIPYQAGKNLSDNAAHIYQVLVKPAAPNSADATIAKLDQALLDLHGGQRDFTLLAQADNLVVANSVLDVLTDFVAGVAAVSLLVGGIGIMNIMLVSVTERTHEIGIRKSVGATNRQIMMQFLIEALVISFLGGIVGIFVAILVNLVLRITTSLQPVINLPIIVLALAGAVVVGIVFGITPALRAARKDPIHALRQPH